MALDDFLNLFLRNGAAGVRRDESIVFGTEAIPVVNGIPRFVPSGTSYSEGNFSRLRREHAKLQLDSVNGTTDRRMTVLDRTNWPKERFEGKLLVECGCGVGPDTEILLGFGVRVIAADLVGLDQAQKNLGENPRLCLIQADITDLPLRKQSFDIVWCHRVLQHTPDPERTLHHILSFVKPDGDVFVHSYAKTAKQMWNWKYVLRPITKRLDPERLYLMIEKAAPGLLWLSERLCRSRLGAIVQYLFVPFRYYGHKPPYNSLSRDQILEYGVHDTFDALAPRYDKPLSANRMRQIAAQYITKPFEVAEYGAITLLRTL